MKTAAVRSQWPAPEAPSHRLHSGSIACARCVSDGRNSVTLEIPDDLAWDRDRPAARRRLGPRGGVARLGEEGASARGPGQAEAPACKSRRRSRTTTGAVAPEGDASPDGRKPAAAARDHAQARPRQQAAHGASAESLQGTPSRDSRRHLLGAQLRRPGRPVRPDAARRQQRRRHGQGGGGLPARRRPAHCPARRRQGRRRAGRETRRGEDEDAHFVPAQAGRAASPGSTAGGSAAGRRCGRGRCGKRRSPPPRNLKRQWERLFDADRRPGWPRPSRGRRHRGAFALRSHVWGGASPSQGFDCSGLVMYVFAQVGVSLSHGATNQQRASTPVPLNPLRPGDLVFYGNASYSYHVAIYVGGAGPSRRPGPAHRSRCRGDRCRLDRRSPLARSLLGRALPPSRQSCGLLLAAAVACRAEKAATPYTRPLCSMYPVGTS